MVSQWEHNWDSGPPSHSPPGAGAPPYLGRPIAMNQDWEGVVSQVPCSYLAHFKLEHHLIWGAESRDLSSIRPTGQAPGLTGWARIQSLPQ